MRTFEEFLEAYGFGNPEEEKLDAELYGIGETLKNALASGDLAYQWGTLGERIRNLDGDGEPEMNFQEFVKKKETLLSEISVFRGQLTQTSDRTTAAISTEFGTVLDFVSDWDLNSQKMPQASTPEDTQGWKVKLANDMVGRDNSRVDATKENLASKIP